MSRRERGGVIVSALGTKENSGYAQGHVSTKGTHARLLSRAARGYFNKGLMRLFPCLWGLRGRQDGAGSTYHKGSRLALTKQIGSKSG